MADTDDTIATYDTITRWLTDDRDRYGSLFGYTFQTLRLVVERPDNPGHRQQALDIIRAVDDHAKGIR